MRNLSTVFPGLEEENRRLRIFFAVSFGLPWLMGVVMAYIYYNYPERSLSGFPFIQMLCPASGVMLAYLCSKNLKPELPVVFYYFFLSVTLCFTIGTLVGVFIGINLDYLLEIVTIGATIVTYFIYYYTNSGKLKKSGLTFRINWRKTLCYSMLFILLYAATTVLASLFLSEKIDINSKSISMIILMPFSLLLAFLPYLGEEYGWRFFLQPILQRRYGNVRGVLILGLVWGIWHLPLNIFYCNDPECTLQSILGQLVFCVALGIFLGYVYLKTENVWSVVIIHFLNNSFAGAFSGGDIKKELISWDDFLLSCGVVCVVYLPFLFAKIYRQNNASQIESVGDDDC